MLLKQAQDIAVAKCYLLEPNCKIIKIAGSVRRHIPEVGDIEIVCLPKTYKQHISTSLFETVTKFTRAQGFITVVRNLGDVVKGNAYGKYMQIALPEGINLDLFMPDEWDYYRIFAFRTGPKDYSAKILAGGCKRIGWCGSDQGLRKIIDCVETKGPDGKIKWKCIRQDAEKPPQWRSEEEFFAWLSVPFTHPSKRII